jgi:hypothetical protein
MIPWPAHGLNAFEVIGVEGALVPTTSFFDGIGVEGALATTTTFFDAIGVEGALATTTSFFAWSNTYEYL